MGNDTRCTKDLFDGQKHGTWEYLFEVLVKDTKLKKKCILMVDSSYIKIHMHATVAKNGNQGIS